MPRSGGGKAEGGKSWMIAQLSPRAGEKGFEVWQIAVWRGPMASSGEGRTFCSHGFAIFFLFDFLFFFIKCVCVCLCACLTVPSIGQTQAAAAPRAPCHQHRRGERWMPRQGGCPCCGEGCWAAHATCKAPPGAGVKCVWGTRMCAKTKQS